MNRRETLGGTALCALVAAVPGTAASPPLLRHNR